MDDVILKEWAELSELALKLNDEKRFPVFLEWIGHVGWFTLRIGLEKSYDPASVFYGYVGVEWTDFVIDRYPLKNNIRPTADNIKLAKDWLTARHGDMVVNTSDSMTQTNGA